MKEFSSFLNLEENDGLFFSIKHENDSYMNLKAEQDTNYATHPDNIFTITKVTQHEAKEKKLTIKAKLIHFKNYIRDSLLKTIRSKVYYNTFNTHLHMTKQNFSRDYAESFLDCTMTKYFTDVYNKTDIKAGSVKLKEFLDICLSCYDINGQRVTNQDTFRDLYLSNNITSKFNAEKDKGKWGKYRKLPLTVMLKQVQPRHLTIESIKNKALKIKQARILLQNTEKNLDAQRKNHQHESDCWIMKADIIDFESE